MDTLRSDTALHTAAFHIQPEHCSFFFARGADPAAIKNMGETAVHSMTIHENVPIGDVCARELRVLDVLVRGGGGGGCQLDVQDADGDTALATACANRNVGLTRALLDAPGEQKGWDRSAEVVVNDDCSPLWPAMEFRRIESVT